MMHQASRGVKLKFAGGCGRVRFGPRTTGPARGARDWPRQNTRCTKPAPRRASPFRPDGPDGDESHGRCRAGKRAARSAGPRSVARLRRGRARAGGAARTIAGRPLPEQGLWRGRAPGSRRARQPSVALRPRPERLEQRVSGAARPTGRAPPVGTWPVQPRGCGTIRMYGFGAFQPAGYFCFAASSETEPAMITSSPGSQLTGVAT